MANRYLVERLRTSTPSPEVRAARTDPNDFCEYAFTDQHGDPIKQATHHRLWQRAVHYRDRVVMWFPIEHGKTTQTKMTWCRLLGQHGDRQYAHLASKAKQAEKVTGAVKREIEGNDKLHEVYPRLVPQRSLVSAALEQWGVTAMRVKDCPRGTADPSLAAYGLDGQILGSRLHGAIIDNGLDKGNTGSDHMRQWAREVIEDEIIGRIHKGGFLWILDTAWYEDDYMHTFAKRPGWYSVRLDATKALADDLLPEEREGPEPTPPPGPLWPKQFPEERLADRLAELGQTAFDRQYRNLPLSESMGFFKSEYWDLAVGRVPYVESWERAKDSTGMLMGFDLQSDLATGVDLATRKGEEHDQSSFASVLSSGSRRRLINLHAERLQLKGILARMVRIYREIHRPINLAGGNARFVVEDNSAQVYVVDTLRDPSMLRALGLTTAEASDIRVVGRTTTAKKRDQELGVPAFAAGIEAGRWDLPSHPETDQLWEECRIWHPGQKHYGDRLMSIWFALSALMTQSTSTFKVDFI